MISRETRGRTHPYQSLQIAPMIWRDWLRFPDRSQKRGRKRRKKRKETNLESCFKRKSRKNPNVTDLQMAPAI